MRGSQLAQAVKAVIAKVPGMQRVYVGELVAGWEERGLPAALVYRVGGSSDGLDRITRLRIDVFAVGLSAASDMAEDVRDVLVYDEFACSYHGTPYGLLDDVEVDLEPVDVPYASATVRQVSTTYRVTTRAL